MTNHKKIVDNCWRR